jgi:hypothetical protein
MVVPHPQNGSYTAWPGEELFSIGRFMHSTGFWVPCSNPGPSRAGICHRVDCLRSPVQLDALSRTAYVWYDRSDENGSWAEASVNS